MLIWNLYKIRDKSRITSLSQIPLIINAISSYCNRHEYRTVGHPQLVRHQRFQFIFRQELTFRHIRADVELGKRFFRY